MTAQRLTNAAHTPGCRCSSLPSPRFLGIGRPVWHALHERKAGARTVHNQQLPQCHKTRTSPLAELTSKASNLLKNTQSGAAALGLSVLLLAGGAYARWEGVNKPELLPKGDFTTVIDVAGFLTAGEERRMKSEIEGLERDKGVKLRVLAQNYPETPGLAIKDYWQVDDMTVVFVADGGTGNLCNFNVGSSVDLTVPRNFWTRLASKYGNKFYWQEKGQGEAITNAVNAIDFCVREPIGKNQCSKIQGEFGEEPSSGKIGKFFMGS